MFDYVGGIARNECARFGTKTSVAYLVEVSAAAEACPTSGSTSGGETANMLEG